MIKHLKRYHLILTIGLIPLCLIPLKVIGNDNPKFILIHLDAASSVYFLQELEGGNLPNLHAFFGDDGRIDYSITYFPSKTPTVITSIRAGYTPREAILPGWKYTNDERSSISGVMSNFLKMAFSTSRLSTTNLVYGLPVFGWLAGPALVNTSYYLKDYDVLQFYWYNVDTQGHFNGEEAYVNELATFDKQFGRLMKRLDDAVNVIIYSDHGMTFGRGVAIDPVIEELVGDDLALFSYPTLFIFDPEKREHYARQIIEETDFDYTFFEIENEVIKGYHKDAVIFFVKDLENETISYEFEGEDVLGYIEKGYNGEFLNRDEWLALTYDTDYPMAPVNIYYHLKNKIAGDIVTLFGEDKFHQTGYSSSGNHGGFTRQDMTTPLLVRGPDVTSLYNRTYYWLPNLFIDIKDVDFGQRPPRERHFAASRYNFKNNQTVSEFSVSPRYRVRYGVNTYNSNLSRFNRFDRVDFWGKADLFRSYLTRFWVGTGFEMNPERAIPLLMLQYDIHIRRVVFQNSFATNRSFYFKVSYEATPWLALEAVNFTSFGVRFDF